MRQVLVDHARRRDAEKRGGDRQRATLTGHASSPGQADAQIDALDLDTALTELAQLSVRQAQVAELRHFGSLTVPQVAQALSIGVSTVRSRWSVAQLWLRQRLGGKGSGS